MAFKTSASRFAFLSDDAPDPFVTVKKPKAKNTSEGGNKTGQQQNKQGGQNNKNKSKSASANSGSTNKNSSNSGKEGSKKKKSTTPNPASAVPSSNPSKTTECGQGDHVHRDSALGRKPGMSDAQWEEWRQRDLDYVSGTFESDMEAALLQSKLDYQTEKNRLESLTKAKAKKKPVSVPLGEFNAMLSNGGGPLLSTDPLRKSFGDSDGSGTNGYMSSFPAEEMERIRVEAQMEMKRERQLELDRELLQSRNHQVPVAPTMTMTTGDNLETRHILEEKDAIIAKLTEEKMELEKELEISKARFKKLWSIVGEANMKDTVFLSAEVEKLTQLNQHLTDEMSTLHSQLEQERSKCHTALLDIRKLEQSRRRTGSTTETT